MAALSTSGGATIGTGAVLITACDRTETSVNLKIAGTGFAPSSPVSVVTYMTAFDEGPPIPYPHPETATSASGAFTTPAQVNSGTFPITIAVTVAGVTVERVLTAEVGCSFAVDAEPMLTGGGGNGGGGVGSACKKGGFARFEPPYRNQGQCVRTEVSR
ncbi:MAG TPA: hypothetical protein VNT58_05650 [Gaiellaceae bacterium]|nr:hypothetical protein [Gaiellaceae bacterium]